MDNNWKVMQQLEDTFNQITTLEFLVTELNEALNNKRTDEAIAAAHALECFLPVFASTYDRDFKAAWDQVVPNPTV